MTAINSLLQQYSLYIPQITWTDVIEIIIIAYVLYNVLIWIKDTRAWALLKGIIIVVALVMIAVLLNLRTILWIAGKAISVGIIAIVIIFQPELRRALEQLGRKRVFTGIFGFDFGRPQQDRFSSRTVEEIINATYELAKDKTGAFIVIEQDMLLSEYEQSGIELDAVVSSQLLINIFEHNTPLHDGAVIVRGDRIVSATCYLTLSDNNAISKELGTRHRAAVGGSENFDCFIIVVSEETGYVSVAVGGELIRNIEGEELRSKLEYIRHKTMDVKSFRLWKGRLKSEGKIVE